MNATDAAARVRQAFNRDQSAAEKVANVTDVGREISNLKWTSDELLEELCEASKFTENADLALHYFHGVSCDHDAWLYNDESLNDEEVVTRIESALEEPIGKKDAVELHHDMKTEDVRICACASCNERLVSHWGDKIHCHHMTKVHSGFNYTREETNALLGSSDLQRKHKMVVQHKGTFLHLNPELIHNELVHLCDKCERDPRGPLTSVFSIANGYDPGLYRGLTRDIKDTTKTVIAAVRGFKNAQLSIRDKLKKGHVILYPSDAPPKVAIELPWTDDVMPDVVFYGTPVQWASSKGNFSRQITVDPVEVYDYLRVLKEIHVDYKLLPLREQSIFTREMAHVEPNVTFPPEDVLRSTGDMAEPEIAAESHKDNGGLTTDPLYDVQHSAMLKPATSKASMSDAMGAQVKGTKSKGEPIKSHGTLCRRDKYEELLFYIFVRSDKHE